MSNSTKRTLNKQQINRGGGLIMHYVGWIMLFGFTATCTLFLFRKYAPPTAPWLPFAGLAIFEYGAIHWLHYHRHNAKNYYQFIVGLVMTVVSVLCISASTGFQLLEWFGVALAGWIQSSIFYAIVVGFILNVIAFILCSLLSPEHFTAWDRMDSVPVSYDARDEVVYLAPANNITVVEADEQPVTEQLEQANKVYLAQNEATPNKKRVPNKKKVKQLPESQAEGTQTK